MPLFIKIMVALNIIAGLCFASVESSWEFKVIIFFLVGASGIGFWGLVWAIYSSVSKKAV